MNTAEWVAFMAWLVLGMLVINVMILMLVTKLYTEMFKQIAQERRR